MLRPQRLLLAILWTCAPALVAQSHLAEGVRALPAHAAIVVMPPDVELFSLTAGGVPEPKADWTAAAVQNLQEVLRQRSAGSGASFVTLAPGGGDRLAEVTRLHQAVARAIRQHHFGNWKLPSKGGRLDWSIGEGAAVIKDLTPADYALFIYYRDSYATAGRKATAVVYAALGVGIHLGAQIGYASLVDLKTGRVLWFNELAKGTGDLRELEPARKSLADLLNEFPG